MLYKPRHNSQQATNSNHCHANGIVLQSEREKSQKQQRRSRERWQDIIGHLSAPTAACNAQNNQRQHGTAQTQTLAATAPTDCTVSTSTPPSLSANFAGQLFHGQTQRAVWRRSWTRALASLLLLLWQQLLLLLLLLQQLQVQLQSAIGNWRNAGQDYAIV